ncbi:MAG: HPr(Ser) kinase/phosphatase [Oscillospiraceae bacterium]|nr:HPr(Ser) kinase/phosphatase [Oscillospiraceae bacterium]
MKSKYSAKLKKLVEGSQLVPIFLSSDYEQKEVFDYTIERPGLQFVGFYDYFNADAMQIIGRTEEAFLDSMSDTYKKVIYDNFFSKKPPCLVLAHKIAVDPIMIESAKAHDVSVFSTDLDTSEFISQILYDLRMAIAPRLTIHGVLVQVYGEGLLIIGNSGIGKSETALEIVKRGHRFIADDAVEIKRVARNRIVGEAPEMLKYIMELRGVGLIDVRRLFGVGAVLPSAGIDLVVNFCPFDELQEIDRMGLKNEMTSYLGVEVPIITVPVAPARNLAIILEIAAMNNREKKMGHNTALEFLNRYNTGIDNGGF